MRLKAHPRPCAITVLAALLAAAAPSWAETNGASPDADRERSAVSETVKLPDGSAGNAWWQRALDDLLIDIEVTPEQNQGIQNILAEAAKDRAAYRSHVSRLRDAHDKGDAEQSRLLREEFVHFQRQLKPSKRIDEIRSVLGPEQLETFDRNRRLRSDRLLAEKQANNRSRRAARQPSARRRKPQAPGPR